jgi:hypothetical protein
LIVFSLRRESLKLILIDEPLSDVVLSQKFVIFLENCTCTYNLQYFIQIQKVWYLVINISFKNKTRNK